MSILRTRFVLSSLLTAATLATFSPGAFAADKDNAGDAKKSARKGDPVPKPEDEPWIRRWRPRRNLWEIGVYGGLFFLSDGHELFAADKDAPNGGWKPMRRMNPDAGLRFGYYPASFLGFEVEAGAMMGALDHDQPNTPKANVIYYTGRGHLVLQIPTASIVPFVLGGVGALGVYSDAKAVGQDVDFAAHFGGGVKFHLSKRFTMRADIRDIWTMHVNNPTTGGIEEMRSHNLEILLGLSLALNRPDPTPPPPEAPKDTDNDGIFDKDDECPKVRETPNGFMDEDGCPESDRDGDGFWDDPEQDKCPDEPGVAPDGCPILDTDGDGIMDPDDKCVEQPETKNGFEDDDGCPDEVPKEVSRFMGVIDGIHFDTGKDSIRADSRVVLKRAIEILEKYPSIRIEISGHTDNRGRASFNMTLSSRRADSVKRYLVDAGIDGSRIETRGAGFSEPIAGNSTRDGRAKNRRIEFKVLSQEDTTP